MKQVGNTHKNVKKQLDDKHEEIEGGKGDPSLDDFKNLVYE
jgi:hypothetical protein